MSGLATFMVGAVTRTARYPGCHLRGSQLASVATHFADKRQYSEANSPKTSKKTGARKGTTPSGKLDDPFETKAEEVEPQGEKEPLERFPDNKNPLTGEIGGPRGPEPTRYGDWERKGRVSDF